MKKLLLIMITTLTIVSCENTTEPKSNNVEFTVNEINNNPIYCKRVWINGSSYSYALTNVPGGTIVDSIKLSKGFGSFTVEYYLDSVWTLRSAETVKYIKLGE